jgi:Hexameric tyrosine-coordinated heme protein (HTHP)
MDALWLSTLKTSTPQEGFNLALKLARQGVAHVQTSKEIRERLRSAYEQDSLQLILSSHVVAVHFQTVALANQWWRDSDA